ncbi:MAG: lysophospholipid acyltransferase family protein [Paramuribaculum sp.]|nr:lysophospholipid acyltransferase family protein [Paramuribaculum sp.]
MSISKLLLRIAGWKVNITVPDYPKCIICVAPHTSNWDFFLGKLAYASVGRKAGFFMKESWFFFPLGCIFRALGGIPVPRKKGSSLVDAIIQKYNSSETMALAITPEGTRSRTDKWRSGFLYIAYGAKIPIVLGAIDYSTKDIIIERTFIPTGDVEADMKAIKDYYRPFKGRYPDKFSAE